MARSSRKPRATRGRPLVRATFSVLMRWTEVESSSLRSGSSSAPSSASRKRAWTLPKTSSSPWARRCSVTFWGPTRVPLVLPRSRTVTPDPSRISSAWCPETEGSDTGIELSGLRPRVVRPSWRATLSPCLPPLMKSREYRSCMGYVCGRAGVRSALRRLPAETAEDGPVGSPDPGIPGGTGGAQPGGTSRPEAGQSRGGGVGRWSPMAAVPEPGARVTGPDPRRGDAQGPPGPRSVGGS